MSLPVRTVERLPQPEPNIHLLATSPGWAKGPSDWYMGQKSDDDSSTPRATSSPRTNGLHDSAIVEDDDMLHLSSELRSSDMDNAEAVHPLLWDNLFSSEERTRKHGLVPIFKALRNALTSDNLTGFETSIYKLLRLQSECPFQDIQQGIADFFVSVQSDLSSKGLVIPAIPRPSKYFKNTIPITTPQEPQSSLFKEAYLTTGRVTNLIKALAWHPGYLEHFTATYNFVMRAEGPLSYPMRHYIAILSSARFKSHYLVKQQEFEYLMSGGEPEWLESVEKSSPKIQKLLEINALLAHSPWLVQPKHVARILAKSDKGDRWSTAELVHAFVIMATFRAAASLAHGLGLNLEVDIAASSSTVGTSSGLRGSSSKKSIGDSDDSMQDSGSDPAALELAKTLTHREDAKEPQNAEQRQKLFEAAEEGAVDTPAFSTDEEWFAKYTAPYRISHSDFDVRTKDYGIFHIPDWKWEEQAFELLQRHYDCATLLDNQIQFTRELTYNQVSFQKNVDTTPFRRSIWYYCHRIQGLLYDDYNYANVNNLLPRHMKSFIKDLNFSPFSITGQDLVNLGYALLPEEKCHIALLATEARKQAELMYSLRALSKHLSGNHPPSSESAGIKSIFFHI